MTARRGIGEESDGPWDLLVIGGGTAGIVAATTAAGLGANVLLVERERTGGDCLWTGCVPSKALLAAASAAAAARSAHRFGVHAVDVHIDFTHVMDHVRAAIAAIAPVDSPETLRAAGVHVVHAEARLVSPRTALVDGRLVGFTQLVLATGASPAVPAIPGLDQARVLTSDTVWDLADLPARLVVLGGGPIGCELAQAFARLGSDVALVEDAGNVLPLEDPDAAALVAASLAADGVRVLTGSPVTAATARLVRLQDGTEVDFDRLLVVVGRTARTAGLGLEAGGVAVDEAGHVLVDGHLRTSNPQVWAAGDLTPHPQFTHVAGVHGSIAAINAVLGLRRRVDTTAVPRVTFTQPEVAAVGRTTTPDDLTVRHAQVDRAVVEGDTRGFTRLALDRRGRIVGATVVGPRAGETLGELTLAVRQRLRPRHLAGTTHAYPTYNDGVWHAAISDVRSRMAAPLAARGTRALAAARRGWLRGTGG